MHRFYITLGLLILALSAFLLFWKLDSVDLEGSEDIYVADSVGYLRHDPFIVPRHHLRKPHAPASPHPFLVQLLTSEVLKIFGLSLYSARILQAFCIVASTAILMFLAKRIFSDPFIAVLTGVVFTTLPIIVRYGRMAVLDPVLTLVEVMAMLWLWSALENPKKKGYMYSFLVGVAVALSMSIKLTGIFITLPILLLYVWFFIKTKNSYFIKALIFSLLSALLFFVLLNDPYSYYFGWTNFSDPKHSNVNAWAMLRGISDLSYWYPFITSLIGIFPFLLLLTSVFLYRQAFKNKAAIFIGAWLLANLPYLLLNPPHITGLSSEWAYMPLFIPLSLIIAKTYADLFRKITPRFQVINIFFAICFYLLTIAGPLFFYGLRLAHFPLPNHAQRRNVVYGDLAVTKIISQINEVTDPALVLVILRGVALPLWLLNDNLKTEPMYHTLKEYAYIITDNLELVTKATTDGFTLVRREKNPSELEIFLLRNINQ